ncbi:SMI1/KNR4 family protein [Streptomyces sp. TR06-5]|uniref:SMI1/KNR4 family protein n=1 Tax=Streptomyces sp. TR06-5 TaxID=3385976 RepID=UPI0039A209F4
MPVHEAWGRVTQWLADHAPVNAATLCPPASLEEVWTAEREMGMPVPQEVREWLVINNGVRDTGPDPETGWHANADSCFLTCTRYPLSTAHMVRVYRERLAYADGDTLAWSPRWIPFAADGDWFGGNFVDMDTGAVGSWGDYGELDLDMYPSLAAYFDNELSEITRYVADHYGELISLSGGRITYDPS